MSINRQIKNAVLLPPLPFQWEVIRFLLRQDMRCFSFLDQGLGKAQPVDEPVLTPSGWKAIGDLRIGDTIMSRTGECKVTGVFPQGEKEVYEVTLQDGASFFVLA